MSSLRCSMVLCAGLAAEILPAAADAGPLNLITNGNFSSYTNSNGQTTTGLGFEPDFNGTLTGWSNSNANGGGFGTNGNAAYNFLFEANTGTLAPADVGAYGNYGQLGLWDNHTNPTGNSWNGQGPTSTTNFVAMDGDFSTAAISQTLTGLTKGTVYEVTFEYAFAQQNSYTGATVQNMQVSLGAHSALVGQYSLPSEGFSGWMSGTLYLQADGSSDVLSFLAIGNVQLPPFALLTDVAMYADPEPATCGVLAVGLAGVVVGARRRRRAASA